MLFITNRYPKQGIETVIGREFDFDLNENAASNSIFFCTRKKQDNYQEIGSENFLNRLKNPHAGSC